VKTAINPVAEINKDNGEIKWSFKLNSLDSKTLDLKYVVNYSSGRDLIVE
jgi:hypothetical protein